MTMMFAMGVMDLMWAWLITLMVVVEKVLPIKPVWLRCSSGLVLMVWGTGQLIHLDLLFKNILAWY